MDPHLPKHTFQSHIIQNQVKAPYIHTTTTSKVLIIYTGGTIGMKNTKHHGYVPVSQFLHSMLSKMIQFHDPNNTYQALNSDLDILDPSVKLPCVVNGEVTYLEALRTPVSLFNKYICLLYTSPSPRD